MTTIVTETAFSRIERVGPQDFDCFVKDAGYIGSAKTQALAQAKIDQYRYQTMSRAPELPASILEAQREAAAQPPIVKAERCACGAPATWEVAFHTEPRYEYFCDTHLDPAYIADPIIWPADIPTELAA